MRCKYACVPWAGPRAWLSPGLCFEDLLASSKVCNDLFYFMSSYSLKNSNVSFFFLSFKGKSWHSFAKNRALVIFFPKTIHSITFCLFFFFLNILFWLNTTSNIKLHRVSLELVWKTMILITENEDKKIKKCKEIRLALNFMAGFLILPRERNLLLVTFAGFM